MMLYANDAELLSRVLQPYRAKKCEYLESATINADGVPGDGGTLLMACDLRITESCYIDDTGHFNSVEFNICFNQVLYYAIAKSVKAKLFEPLASWSMDDFWKRQLPNILITDFRSSFRSPMRGPAFSGEFELTDVAEWSGSDIRAALITLRTRCRYWDETGGACQGEVGVVITDPPAENLATQ